MNWVGGARSRFMKNKEDTMKQRVFFQKQRMKAKCKNVDPQASPNGNSTGNMDLLTLFIVNQIASKKMHSGKPKMNLFNKKETKKTLNEPLELPMSPCSPSKLNLVTSQPQYMVTANSDVDTPGFKVGKHQISNEFKFKPLSPLLESNLSDVSGSEKQPHILNTVSSLPDPFSIQSKPASHVSPSLPSQENPDPDSMKFVPFSQRIKPANPCTDVAKEAHVMQNSPVAETQFGITLPNTGTADESANSVLYPTSPLKSSEQQEEPLFIDFKSPHTENIFLETSLSSSMRIKNSDGSQNMDRNGDFLTQIKKQAHDVNAEKNATIMQDAGTQTADFPHNSCCDVSVQCSLIHANSINSTSVHTTRRQSVHFNEVSAGASATKVQAQTQPKLPKGLSSRKSHRQASMKKTPILKRPLRKGLELKVGQLMECRVNIERCKD
ncbi:uncharacterized protein LOC130420553 isoform X2 [Triplophysa dalaica]|uniref:uncharacterized protein LOC130420553 isoform X2 n=1 Tax=Triplophysa dalaica TaxID=1582913 RepID=UPI0024DFCA0F|nr:uncharacterized protein LOC130420553 isoform X2 [Triplophysa dalaica]